MIKLTFVCYNKNIRPMITDYTVACVLAQPSCDYHQLLELDCVLYVSKHFSDKYAYEQKQLWMIKALYPKITAEFEGSTFMWKIPYSDLFVPGLLAFLLEWSKYPTAKISGH